VKAPLQIRDIITGITMSANQRTNGAPFKRGRGRGFRVRPTNLTAASNPTPTISQVAASNATSTVSQGDHSTNHIDQGQYGDAYSNVSFSFSHDVPAPTTNQINFMRRAQFVREMRERHEAAGTAYQEVVQEAALPVKQNLHHSTAFNAPSAPSKPFQGVPAADQKPDVFLNKSFQGLSFSKPATEDEADLSDAETDANDSEDERILLRKVKNPRGKIDDQIIGRQEIAPKAQPPSRPSRVLPAGLFCPLPPAVLPPTPEPVQSRLSNIFAELAQREAAKQAAATHHLQVPSSKRTITGQRKSAANITVPSTKPPKRVGYGFSYSDPAFNTFTSDMPDTDSEGEAEADDEGKDDEQPKPLPGASVDSFQVRFDQAQKVEMRNIPVNNTFTFAATPQDEPADLVVLRSMGSFNLTKPQRILPCTSATREDTIRVKAAANALLKFDESADIYGALAARLERMVQAAMKQNGGKAVDMGASARKLRDFVFSTIEARVETGEMRGLVEHECEWVQWFVLACTSGVMHVKTSGCGCRGEWEQ